MNLVGSFLASGNDRVGYLKGGMGVVGRFAKYFLYSSSLGSVAMLFLELTKTLNIQAQYFF